MSLKKMFAALDTNFGISNLFPGPQEVRDNGTPLYIDFFIDVSC